MKRELNILWILIICLGLFTACWFQLVKHKVPCHLCLFQRLALAGIGISILMNLRYGSRMEHYAYSILFALIGCLVSFRLAPFGGNIFGHSLSSWSAMVFLGSIVGACILLLFHDESPPKWRWPEKSVFSLLTLLVLVNMATILSMILYRS